MRLRSNSSRNEDESVDRLVRIFQSEAGELRAIRPPWQARATVLSLAGALALLVVVSVFIPIDRVVDSVSGQLVTVDPNVVLQPLDISIIKSIDVMEGDRVKKGQLIASLDPTLTTADVVALQIQIDALDAQIARCDAELSHAPYLYTNPHPHGEVDYAAIQHALFDQRKLQFDSQVHYYDEQMALQRATIVQYTDDLATTQQRGSIAQQVEKMWTGLEAKDSGSLLQTLTAKDSSLQLVKAEQLDRDSIVETQHQIQATTASRDAFIQQWQAQTSQEVVLARTQRDSAHELLEKALEHQGLVRLIAPDDAIVLRMEKRSVGSVLQPGEAFAELTLLNSPIEAEIFIDPRDIGFIRPGDRAVIKFDPYHFVEHGSAEGKVSWVSEGTFTVTPSGSGGTTQQLGTSVSSSTSMTIDSSSVGQPYYKARITLTSVNLIDVPKDYRLLAGETLSADIHVGTHSAFWYFVRGLVRGYDEAMREP